MRHQTFRACNTYHVTRITIQILIIALFFITCQVVNAETNSNPPIDDIIAEEEIIVPPTTTEDIIIPTSTESNTSTIPTSTEEIPSTTTFTDDLSKNEITLATTSIHFQINTYDAKLFDENFVVTECQDSENGTTTTLNIWCAIQQLAEQKKWEIFSTWGGYGVTYDINKYKGNDYSDGMWWGWYSNLNPGETGVNAHLLTKDENILLTYGIEPSRLITDSSEPTINTSTTIQFQKFDWGTYGWTPNSSSTFVINNEEFFDNDGIYNLEITTTTPYEIFAKKDGYINSESIIITPTSTTDTTTTNNDDDGNDDNSNDNNNGNSNINVVLTNEEIRLAVNKILNYFISAQEKNGMVYDANTTDWVIMSFGADNQYSNTIIKDKISLTDYADVQTITTTTDSNVCAGYARHILSYLANGSNKPEKVSELVANIKSDLCYSLSSGAYGEKFGSGTNDDVFTLLALLGNDENISEEIIVDLVDNIKKSQDMVTGGFSIGWGMGADATGVSISALKYAQKKGFDIDTTIFDKATKYLHDTQLNDGGWNGWDISSDVLTTSWAIMGINSLDQSESNWFNSNHKNPWHVLSENLKEGGYYPSTWSPHVEWFSMKHAVPALLGKSWPIILASKVLDTNDYRNSVPNNVPPAVEIATTTPTTTAMCVGVACNVPTTTVEIVTTTLQTPTTSDSMVQTTGSNEESINQETNKSIKQKNSDQTPSIITPRTFSSSTSISPSSTSSSFTTTETLSSASSTIPYSKTAKGLLATATAGATSIGLYLGWRLLQTLL